MTSLALNFLGGAPFQLLYESVKIALGKCRKFRTHLENLEITLDCLQPWIIQQIRANNVQLNLPNDLIHDLEVKMEEGRELVHRLSRLGIWDIRIWGNCYNCTRPNYAKQLTELDRSLRRLLEILKLEALRNVQENLLLARNHKDKQNEMDKNVLELLKVHNEVLKMQHEICDMMRLQHEAVQRLLVDGTQIMRGEATPAPAPAPCPVIGFVFRMLCDVVTRVKVKNTMCRRLVQEFKSTLDFLKPLMEEMTECNTLLHLPEQEQEKLIIRMRKGVELIYKCSKVRKWASYKSHTCTKDLLILDGYLQELFYKMSLQIAKHEKEALVSIKSMEAVITKVKESGGVVQNQIQAVLSKPEPPLLEGRLDVLHTHVRVENIEGNSVRQNEIVIPSSSQVTETSSPITGLDVQETTDINETMNDPSLSRSAPTNVLSSSAVSPQRSTLNDVFPFFDQYQGPVLLSPNKPALPSSSLSPLHSPTLRSPRFSPNDSIANAHPHPLPLPLPLPQPQNVGHNECLSSMKGQWKKGRLIGRGTFGSVYVAFNRETGALCAMKEVDLNPDDPKSAECIKQLEQEIKVLGTLKHPNIVQYYGSEVIDDHFYMYLEYVHPGPINKYVQEHIGTMSESVVRYFTRQILSGLAFLHDTKTIHRDIKAANLLVDTSGVVKLADFGMAKHLDAHSFGLSLKKSPYWMAPEVILALNTDTDSDPNLALAVDIWSLGCTIIEMFKGKPPWSECEGPEAVFNVLNKSPDIPEALSAEGKEFLSLCFRRSPAERPSAKKLLEHSFLRNSSDQNLSKWLMSINPSTLAINSNHTISLPGSPLYPGEKRCKTETQAFRTKSELDVMDDGFKWRKYGEKSVKDSPYTRNYYKCAYEGCRVQKRTERDREDPAFVITTCQGIHNHGGNEKTFVAMGRKNPATTDQGEKKTPYRCKF